MSEQQPSEEELRAALEEQMRHIRVEDVLLQTIVTLINLGARRMGLTGNPEEAAGERDLGQAQLAIEGARALMPLTGDSEELKPLRDALSQLQMAYVQASGGSQPAQQEQSAEDAERAKARSKLWTPGDS